MTPQTLLDLTARNTAFSRQTPGLQLALDSTSLGAFKTCPRYYQLANIEGWQPKRLSVHLTFGLHLHRARETYDHKRMQGQDHDDALDEALSEALRNTWDKQLGRPWLSDNPEKNRASLLRTIVWYLDEFGRDDPIQTLRLANGKPAVELSFRYDTGIRSSAGEAVLSCGHLDRVGAFAGSNWIVDIKTTKSQLSPKWFKSFTPGNQFSTYKAGGQVAFNFEIAGIIVDGIQVGATFCRVQRSEVPRTDAMMDEWFKGLEWWFRLMEACARAGEWPMNETSCDKYGGCQFREICSMSPSRREQWLKADFTRRIWDPLQVRGDV